MTETPFDTKRRLCPDGSCIGVIGPDGRCSVCGRNTSGKPGVALVSDAQSSDAQVTDAMASGDADDLASEAATADATSGGPTTFDPNRRLCDDGSCVGVIGADGRCGVCGRQPGA
jgi:hypothetical protein